MVISFDKGWQILQDVHDAGEALGLYNPNFQVNCGNQISEWEELPELKQLQLIYARQPYFGRELRYFNQAPWWYRLDFSVEETQPIALIRFTNVDYYCKIWLNGQFIGAHEGYSTPFQFPVGGALRAGGNTLIVKVWSPWDDVVDGESEDLRTFLINRNQIKGTYEHSDTFVQRDVNPVGIYGDVTLKLSGDACFEEMPDVTYELDGNLKNAHLAVSLHVKDADKRPHTVRMRLTDRLTKQLVCHAEQPAKAGVQTIEADVQDIRLWSTWDKGGAWLYDVQIELLDDAGNVLDRHSESVGFRKIEMIRDESQTRFLLNGRGFYVRGTSYFPDVYVSNMCYERYRRDMLAVKAAGFNLIRIHVHVELPMLYEICSEIGIGILQDSEYNWMHPVTDEFADRFIDVYLDTVRMLKRNPSIFCWICMNEPGLQDPMGKSSGRAMTVNPGPRLYKTVREIDPSRPAIKGSFCEDDPDSGDSHNYAGSLNGDDTRYQDIYGTTEKFNTEYGFDAPPCLTSLTKCEVAYHRLSRILDKLPEIGAYQYKLLKYYTEHYRMQKYAPNGGYVQFLFNDLCPQSFYGIYDYWGLPKPGLVAMLESNMPVGVFLKYNGEKADAIYAVSDEDEALGVLTVEYVFTGSDGEVIARDSRKIELGADGIALCWKLNLNLSGAVNCALILRKGTKVIASNHYEDLFNFPEHVKGHPSRMSHESGMRTYFA